MLSCGAASGLTDRLNAAPNRIRPADPRILHLNPKQRSQGCGVGDISDCVLNRWTKLLAWLVAVPIVLVTLLFLVALAFAWVGPSPTRDARRAEGEQLMRTMSEAARLAHSRRADQPQVRTLTGDSEQGGCGVTPQDLGGRYFRISDDIQMTPEGGVITCEPIFSNSDGVGRLYFKWQDGGSHIEWQP